MSCEGYLKWIKSSVAFSHQMLAISVASTGRRKQEGIVLNVIESIEKKLLKKQNPVACKQRLPGITVQRYDETKNKFHEK